VTAVPENSAPAPTSSFDPTLDLGEPDAPTAGKAPETATPVSITLGTHNACNAKCIFCMEGRFGGFGLDFYKEFFEKKLGPYLAEAEQITFTGFGETLLLPDIAPFLDHLNRTLPNTKKIFTTNGTALTPGVVEKLRTGKYLIQISLHASRADIHEQLTLLPGEFSVILENIRALRKAAGENLEITLVNVVNTLNVDDLPEFVKLGWDLGVHRVRAYYLTAFKPEHLRLSCFFDQARANRALQAARELHQSLASRDSSRRFQLFLPASFGSSQDASTSPVQCRLPWQHIFVDIYGSVLPCCQWGEVVDNLNKTSAEAIWNGPFYKTLRASMSSGDLLPACQKCPRFKPANVNDLLAHITSRPDQKKAILAALSPKDTGDVGADVSGKSLSLPC